MKHPTAAIAAFAALLVVPALPVLAGSPQQPKASASERPTVFEERNRKLLRAVATGDYGSMQTLLKQGADIEAREPGTGRTPLLIAVEKRRALFVRYLLEQKADAQARLNGGRTVLHLAVTADDSGAVVQALLVGGANPNAADDAGVTPLMDAAGAGSDRMVQFLLSVRPQPTLEARDAAGETAAMRAVAAPPATAGTTLRLLAKAKANLNATRPSDGMTPLLLAARAGRADVVSALLALGAAPDRKAKNGRTALSYARERGDGQIVRLLSAGEGE